MNIFEQTPPNRRRYGLAAFIGLIAGVVSAFVKWGAEVPLPPRSPVDMFNAACGPESLIRAAGQIDCSRNFLNPPYIFLRDWLGLTDPNAAVYTFAGHVFNWVGVTHIWICPYISRHLLSLNPLLACCRRYSRGER